MIYSASPWNQEATRRARSIRLISVAAGDGAISGKQPNRKPTMKPNSADLRLSSSASSAIVEDETRTLSLLRLTLLGLSLGIVTGIGAVLFRELIGLLHNLFFAGRFVFAYDANKFTAPSRWGAFVILAPVVGGVIVTFLVSNFAPEAKGHGVPGSDGRHLLQRGHDPADRRPGEVARLGGCDRQRLVGRPRRSDHSDRLGDRLDARPDRRHARRANASPWSPPARARASPRPSTRRSAA